MGAASSIVWPCLCASERRPALSTSGQSHISTEAILASSALGELCRHCAMEGSEVVGTPPRTDRNFSVSDEIAGSEFESPEPYNAAREAVRAARQQLHEDALVASAPADTIGERIVMVPDALNVVLQFDKAIRKHVVVNLLTTEAVVLEGSWEAQENEGFLWLSRFENAAAEEALESMSAHELFRRTVWHRADVQEDDPRALVILESVDGDGGSGSKTQLLIDFQRIGKQAGVSWPVG